MIRTGSIQKASYAKISLQLEYACKAEEEGMRASASHYLQAALAEEWLLVCQEQRKIMQQRNGNMPYPP